jgi:oligoribonuclease
MDEWCTKTHGESGLTQACLESKVTLREAEEAVLKFLRVDCGIKHFTAPMAGNSIATDKSFLFKEMNELYNFLHY